MSDPPHPPTHSLNNPVSTHVCTPTPKCSIPRNPKRVGIKVNSTVQCVQTEILWSSAGLMLDPITFIQ